MMERCYKRVQLLISRRNKSHGITQAPVYLAKSSSDGNKLYLAPVKEIIVDMYFQTRRVEVSSSVK